MIIAACLAPLCWFGSPADFWFIAVGALISTVVGCVLVLIQEGLDVNDKDSCYNMFENGTETGWEVNRPAPESALGFGKGSWKTIVFNKLVCVLLQLSVPSCLLLLEPQHFLQFKQI